MTLYIAAYDVESPGCLAGTREIVALHRRFDMPATFFVVGKRLEENPAEYRELLDDPLFEIASHTYSHKMLRDHPFCGPAASEEQVRDEIFLGKAWVERVFERPCLGMRPGCGFEVGLKDAPQLLQLVREAGYRYVSSLLWGPQYTMPTPLNQPFSYAKQSFPDVWELPGHGWHENLLKDKNRWGGLRILLFPPIMPEAIPTNYIQTPEEEFAVNNKPYIDKALAEGLTFVSLVWHPWSLNAFDPALRMLEMTFRYVRERGLPVGTYADLLTQVQQANLNP